MVSIRTVLVLAARHNWEIHQVDVKSAYLYGELNKGLTAIATFDDQCWRVKVETVGKSSVEN